MATIVRVLLVAMVLLTMAWEFVTGAITECSVVHCRQDLGSRAVTASCDGVEREGHLDRGKYEQVCPDRALYAPVPNGVDAELTGSWLPYQRRHSDPGPIGLRKR